MTTELVNLPMVVHGNVDAGLRSLTRAENAGLNITVLDPDGHMTSEELDPQEFPLPFRTVVGRAGRTPTSICICEPCFDAELTEILYRFPALTNISTPASFE